MEKIDIICGCVYFFVVGIENIFYISLCINGYFFINLEIIFFINLNYKIKKNWSIKLFIYFFLIDF